MRGGNPGFNYYNRRGDVVTKLSAGGTVTWQASYEAFGKRTQEFGTNLDRQRANTKEEDPTGLLNEGFRYRCLETGIFITRDPLGFVDGPNLYTYVRQNPWTHWDADGLSIWTKAIKFVVKGGDVAATTEGIVSDIAAATSATNPAVSAAYYFSALSEVLPVSIGDVKDVYRWGTKGKDLVQAGKSTEKAAGTLKDVERQSEKVADINKGSQKVATPGGSTQKEIKEGKLSSTSYPNPDPPMSAPPVRYEPKTNEEVFRMRGGQGPTTKKSHGDQNIEAHHRQQKPVEKGGKIDEITQQQHRGEGNHSRHQKPSELSPKDRAKEIRDHYKERGKEYQTGDGEGI
jgi:RHS repeat-associated protein